MTIRYRLLPHDEWYRLKKLMPDEFMPAVETATFAVAEDEMTGEVLGVLCLQLQLHMEPMVIKDPAVSFKRLHHTLHAAVSNSPGLRYFAFADTDKVNRMAELVGMTPLPYAVWMKEV